MEIKIRNGAKTITFLVDDGADLTFQRRVVEDGIRWLKEAQNRIGRAINYSLKAMHSPSEVADAYWEFLYMYFGIPVNKDKSQYLNDINSVLAKLNQSLIGLSSDNLVIGDLSQMPGIAKAQLNCMNTISSLLGKESSSVMTGLIFVDVVEIANRYIESFWKSSPSAVTINPFASPILLNFPKLWEIGERYSVVTLIHEATHKFAQTTDEQYFPELSGWDHMENAIEQLRPLMYLHYPTFDALMVDARKIMLTGKFSEAAKKIGEMARVKTLNNADSVANYAYEVAEFPSTEELEKAIKRMLG